MQEDVVTIRLRLPGLRVLGTRETGRCIEVVGQYEGEEAICPGCGRPTWQVHQWHLQRKRDAKLWGKEVWLALFKRRFRCRHCGKVFTEPDPTCGSRRRTTERLQATVARRARAATAPPWQLPPPTQRGPTLEFAGIASLRLPLGAPHVG